MQEDVCRACLSSDEQLLQFDQHFIESYYVLTNVTVSKVDGLPQTICSSCKMTVEHYIAFRNKCIESEAFFNNILLEQSKEEDSLEVKEEPSITDISFANDDDSSDHKDVKLESLPVETIIAEPVDVKRKVTKTQKQKETTKKKRSSSPKEKQESRKKTRSSTKKSEISENNEASKKKTSLKVKDEIKIEFYDCGLCPTQLPTKAAFFEHLDQHLKSESPCQLCSEPFTEWQEMAAHRYRHVLASQMVCHLCEKRFKSQATQENHYYSVHSEKGRERPKTSRKYVYKYKKYICDHCNKAFSTKQKLNVHIAIHLPRQKQPCPDCGKTFLGATSLKFHRKTMHSSEGEYCTSCQRRVPSLDEHECTRRGICPVCGKRMAVQSIELHMLAHTSERRYKCEECGNSYKWESSLKSHMNKHRGRRPYRCTYCPMAFYTFNVLQKHRRTHTGERPYVCEICGKGFTGSYNLKMHMKVHGQTIVTKKGLQTTDTLNFFADNYTNPNQEPKTMHQYSAPLEGPKLDQNLVPHSHSPGMSDSASRDF